LARVTFVRLYVPDAAELLAVTVATDLLVVVADLPLTDATSLMFDSAWESEDMDPLILPQAEISALSAVTWDWSWVIGACSLDSKVLICDEIADELSAPTEVMNHLLENEKARAGAVLPRLCVCGYGSSER